jgi:RNA polymerase-binding protein DksA
MPRTAGRKPATRQNATARTMSPPPARRAAGSGTNRVAAKKPLGGRSVPKKPAAKTSAKKAAVKKTAAKKASAKKTAAKKTAAKKTAAKKTAPKKTAPKKTAPKKTAPKKTAPKKTAPKKTPPTRPAAKKTPPAAGATAKRPAPAGTPAGRKAAPAKAASGTTGKAELAIAVLGAPSGTPTKGRSGKKTVICPLSGFEVIPAPANLGAKTLDRLRQKLLDEKDRLHHQAEELAAEAEQLAREREAGDTQFDEESGEGDTVNIERERDLLLSATARQVVEEIDDALERIKRGKYGVCKPAGRKISLERLEAIPWAQVCVDCKARAERRR